MSYEQVPEELLQTNQQDTLRVMAIGSPRLVESYIALMFKQQFAYPDEWSKPISVSKSGDVARILTKRTSSNQTLPNQTPDPLSHH
ncbi:MAG TPA: hypothetical protein ACFE0H_11355 [Elainellaceae cyanobacterium]